jgi:hypothetical protein
MKKKLFNFSKLLANDSKNSIFMPSFLILQENDFQYFYGANVELLEMGIRTVSDYVKFYVGLNMQDSISLSSFAYNEKLVLKNKTATTGKLTKELIAQSLSLLDDLLNEIRDIEENAVMEKYAK